mgnify:CR=1 FL=1
MINPANPRVVGPAMADSITGFYAAYGVLGALYERNHTGKGKTVELSMLESMFHFNLDAFTHCFSENEVMGPYSRPSVSQSYVLECAGGKWIALHMSSPEKFWQGLANAIEKPDLFDDPRFSTRPDRIKNHELLIDVLGGYFKKYDVSEWCRRLEAEDVPHSPMYNTREAIEDPQAKHLQLKVSSKHSTMGEWSSVRNPITYDGERNLNVTPPPVLGQHNDELREKIAEQLEKTA